MNSTDILVVILIVIVVSGIAILYVRLTSTKRGEDSEAMKLLQNQLGQLTTQQDEKLDRMNALLREQQKQVNEQLNKSQTSLQQQFAMSRKALQEAGDSTSKIVKEVTEKLTKLDETNKQVVGFAEQLQSLENILKNPKQRGVLGEYYLETVLKNVLPPEAYSLQYKFKNGEIVDAIVKVKDQVIPVDAKFSLENYNRLATAETKSEREKLEKLFKQDLMNRIDETSKYIRPDEGTVDFAFMFMPADGLYYDLLVQKVGAIDVNTIGLVEYAFQKRVILVSPTTFFAYLQTVLQGLRALQIEEQAKDIQKNVSKLQNHLRAYSKHMDRLGKHLGTTAGAYNSASKEFGKIDKDLVKISGGENLNLTMDEVEKPGEFISE